MRAFFTACCILLFTCSAFGAPELKGTPSDLKGFLYPTAQTVLISATSNETAYTDKAIVSVVITKEAKTLSDAISSNAKLRERIVGALINKGILQANIKSSKFASSPEYGWFGKKPASFKVVNRIAVSIVSEAHLELVAKVADMYEGVELASVVFEHSKKAVLRQKVKAKALANIMEQKKHYEKALGLKLTTIGIKDHMVSAGPTNGAQVVEEVIVTGIRREKYRSSSSHAPPRETSFDEVNYQARLSVEFKIEP